MSPSLRRGLAVLLNRATDLKLWKKVNQKRSLLSREARESVLGGGPRGRAGPGAEVEGGGGRTLRRLVVRR